MGNARSRVIFELIVESKRFGTKDTQACTLGLTEGALAQRTGLTRETVNRELRKLKEEGMITYRKGLIVNNLKALEAAQETSF